MVHLLDKFHEHVLKFGFQGTTESRGWGATDARSQSTEPIQSAVERGPTGFAQKGLQTLNVKRLENDLLKIFGDGRD